MKNLKLDESCISNPKSDISNWTGLPVAQSNLKFRLSGLRCRICPISAGFLLLAASVLFSAEAPFPTFIDVAAKLGITLMNICGGTSKDYIVEANGNGAAFLDYN